MAKKKKINTAKELTTLGVTLGVGTQAIGAVSPAFAGALSSGVSPMLPAVGSAAGAGMVMGQLRGLQKAARPIRRRKRRR